MQRTGTLTVEAVSTVSHLHAQYIAACTMCGSFGVCSELHGHPARCAWLYVQIHSYLLVCWL